MIWNSVHSDGPPKFDTLVLCRGRDKSFGFWRYAIAYNQTYRPDMIMTQVLQIDEEHKKKLPILLDVPFSIEEYTYLEQ